MGQTDSNKWQLDSKTAKVPSLSSGPGTLTNKRAKLQTSNWIFYKKLQPKCRWNATVKVLTNSVNSV